MNEKEYFERSRKEKLSLRCPIIGKCERYALTIYYLSELNVYGEGETMEERLRDHGYLTENYEKDKIAQIGETVEFSKSHSTCTIRKVCPEVALFDNGMIYPFIPKKAITSGFYDDFWEENQFGEDKKFEVHKFKHYCECPEFSQYHYENKVGTLKRRTQRRRVPISKKLRFEVFQRDKFTCQYCGRGKEDNVKLQIDHITPLAEGGTDDFSNLITSCVDCNLGKSNKIISYTN